MVKELLKESEIKANQAQTTDGRTALYIASIKGFLEVVQVLLVHPGINVNQARTNYGDTHHYVASQEGHVEIVKAPLAQPNINVNQAQTDLEWKGISPLWIASFNRHAEVVKELLK